MSHTLNEKLALITGAASGIGLATARLMASRGADLALVDLSEKVNDIARELQDQFSSQKITGHVCDVARSSQVNSLFANIKQAHTRHPAANIIVNSAGIAMLSALVDMQEQDFDKIVNINLKGTFLVTQAAVRALVENFPNFTFSSPTQTYASIVNLSSMAKQGMSYGSAYSLTKAGVDGFSRAIAKELGKYRIRCNAVCPSFVETPMVDMANEKKMGSITALGRMGKAEEIAELITFLASDASSYMNSVGVEINGGM